MATAELHFFHADDPNGSTIFECSTDDEFVKSIELDIQRDSLGSGKVSFARKVPTGLFTRQIVVPETLVRVLIPAIHPTKYTAGFFINPRQQQVVSKDESGGEGFTFAGPGPKHYLTRMLLWSASFTGIDSAVDKDAGIWRWPETARAGRILNRLLMEDAANPSGPFLPDLHASFDDTDDSDGVPWAEDLSDSDGSFILKIQDDYLKLLWTIEDASGITTQIYLGEVGDPVIRLDAFQTYGRDLTDDVAFVEGVNIRNDLGVEGSSYRKASHALVRGDEGVYNLAFKPSWSPGDLKKVVGTAYDSTSGAVLDRYGERFLQRQDDGEDQIDLRIVTGFDEASGLYMPGPDYIGGLGHFWVGDTVSLTTGQSQQTQLDYDDEPQTVTGIEFELTEAVRDDDSTKAARSWDVTVHLNEQRKSSRSSVDLAGNRGTVQQPVNPLQLCQAGTFEGSPSLEFLGSLGAACSSSGTNLPSNYPPWSGDNEERVLIQIPSDVPVGHGLIAVIGAQQVNWGSTDTVVYDEAGNTWVKDAEHENTSSSSDDTVQIWHCNVTNALSAGDYIRWALNLGGSSDPASEANGRCIGVAEFNSTLTVDTVGTGAGTFSSTPSITVPGGSLMIAALCAVFWSASDVDWEALIPQTEIGGSGALSSAIFAQYQMGLGNTVFNPSLSASDDWSAIGVSYDFAPIDASNIPRDGNADLVGTSKHVARCDHRHDVHRDTEPTVDDDWETAGYKIGTIWAVLDDLTTPTEIVSVWVLVDDTTGAAVWLEWPGGGSPGGSAHPIEPAIGWPTSFAGAGDQDFTTGSAGSYANGSGSSGTVSVLETSTATNKFQLTDHGLLVQTGTGINQEWSRSHTLADGNFMVLMLTAGTPSLGDNMFVYLRLSNVGTEQISIAMEQDTTSYEIQSNSDSNSTGVTLSGNLQVSQSILFAVSRVGLVYRGWVSRDGGSWRPVYNETFSAAMTTVRFGQTCHSTAPTYMPYSRFLFIREVTPTQLAGGGW